MESARQTPRREDRFWRYAMLAPILFLLLVCGYYREENWRGQHGWNQLKQRLEASNGHVDWTNYVPTPILEEENFFSADKMQRWFAGRGGNELTSRLDNERNSFLREYRTEPIATVTVVKRDEIPSPGDADVTLVYDAALLTVELETQANSNVRSNEPIPLIVMDEVPLRDAIKNLAHVAAVNYILDPKAEELVAGPTTVSLRWEDLRPREALSAVLKTYSLRFMPDSKTGVGRIVVNKSGRNGLAVDAGITNRLAELLEKSLDAATNAFQGKCAYTAMGVMLAVEPTNAVKPVRVVLRADDVPPTNEVAAIFPALRNTFYPNLTSGARVEAAGSNSFVVRLDPIVCIRAADYLKWSDELADEFDLIRAALKRPYAQIQGNYQVPITIPIPNFVSQRVVAQTLTDRAKCHLLLGQPEAALDDLTLVRGLCRVMEGHPSGRPVTLVATMIDSAITSLYGDAIAEGLRLGAWREPELAALQAQLKQIDLPPLLAESFEFERASACRTMETLRANDVEKLSSMNASTNLMEKMKNPTYLLFTMGPRGWVYQNMSRVASFHEELLKGLDAKNRRVSVVQTDKATREMVAGLGHFSPYNYLAIEMVPNFLRAVQWLSRNQCMADEAVIACGLERYRLAHGAYPKTLDALVPQYLEKVPRDIINGEPLKYRLKHDGQFVLYSIGWNETDDGGVPGPKTENVPDLKQGDWVWAAR
jgi:hypothetical protein